jgi:hypothetical protein
LLLPFLAPSQSLDWQGAARPTGGAFRRHLGQLGVLFTAKLLDKIQSFGVIKDISKIIA